MNVRNEHTDDLEKQIAIASDVREREPWHIDVEVVPGVRTGDLIGSHRRSHGPVSFIRTEQPFKEMIRSIYPAGLQGRRVLDCACNCGAYSLWSRDLGADFCYGFDAREHWIDQAWYLRAHRPPEDQKRLKFDIGDVMELPSAGLQPFHLTLFSGIFYHLPLPLIALRAVADLTDEILYLNSGSRRQISRRPALVLDRESTGPAMSGVHGLNWYPTGPDVLIPVLEYLGFIEFQVLFRRRTLQFNRQRGLAVYLSSLLKGTGRFALLASKKKGLLPSTIDGISGLARAKA